MGKKLALVKIRDSSSVQYYVCESDNITAGDCVIIEAERGLDYGEVLEIKSWSDEYKENIEKSIKRVVRKADQKDIQKIEEGRKKIQEALDTCEKKIREFNLPMKLVDGEYSFDHKKVIFYFTAESRIDFRNLVKALAKIFRVRIEMRQIGVRDEAKFLGGVGPCGRILCCASFLKSFEPVTIKMAKVQKLPLNPQKMSGICGRLMCCLSYEYKCYREYIKGLPKEGQMVDTPKGKGKVVGVNVLKRLVYVELETGVIEKLVYPKKDG